MLVDQEMVLHCQMECRGTLTVEAAGSSNNDCLCTKLYGLTSWAADVSNIYDCEILKWH